MATLTIPYANFVALTVIMPDEVDANFDAIADYINDRDTGVATWTAVKVSSTAANPVDVTGSASTTELSINNTATDGDPILSFELSGTAKLTMGVDDSDSDKFKMAHAAVIGTAATDDLIIDTATGAVAIRGTAAADAAAAGFVGESVPGTVSTFTNVGAGGTFTDLTSISLTAGDWDVAGFIGYSSNGGTWSGGQIGISTTSGNSTAGLTLGLNRFQFGHASSSATPTDANLSIPSYRISLAATTTVYLKQRVDYSAGTPQTIGSLTARRVR
jgi:hypothetical protein